MTKLTASSSVPLKLRLTLPFDDNLVFDGFLPESEKDVLNLTFAEGKYLATVYLSDRKQQLDEIVANEIPDDPRELGRFKTLVCKALCMEVQMVAPPSKLLRALEDNKPTADTDWVFRAIFDIVVETHNGIVSYFRDILKQHWLDFLDEDPNNYAYFLDMRCRAQWLDSEGRWRALVPPGSYPIHIALTVWDSGADSDTWSKIPSFIMAKHGRAPMADVLVANSLMHLRQKNGRLALVEAVAALESTVKQLMPKAIRRLPGSANITTSQIDNLMKEAGLRLVTDMGLKLVAPHAGFRDEDITAVAKAIDDRNQVIHSGQREVDIGIASKYVSAIRRIIDTFRRWTQDRSSRVD